MFRYMTALSVALTLLSAGMVRAEDENPSSDKDKAPAQGELKLEISGPKDILFRLGDAALGGAGAMPFRVKLGEYWIGVAVKPLDQEEHKAKQIEGEGGVIVEQVLPDSPAAKAGLQPQDVIVKAGEKALATVGDLIDVVNDAKENGLKVEVVRDGKGLTVEVKPEKRGEVPMTELLPPADAQRLQQWMEKIEKDMGEGKPGMPFRFHVFRPGAIVPPDVLYFRGHDVRGHDARALPDDVTVNVTRTGKKPAKVVIEQGDKRYEATEDKLDDLPKEVRPFAESMLGHPPMAGVRVIEPSGEETQQAPVERPLPRLENRLERRLEEMNQRIEKLNKAVEDMRAARKQRAADSGAEQ